MRSVSMCSIHRLLDVYCSLCFFFSSRRRHTRWTGDWSSDVCSSDLSDAVARGFTAVKMNATAELQYVDSHAKVDAVLRNMQAVRDAVGPDIGLALDFHGRVHKPMAKVLMRELAPYRLMFIEEPVLSDYLEAIPELAAITPAPIALGERLYSRRDFKRVLQQGDRKSVV